MRMSMFSNTPRVSGSSSSSLVEFKAGRSNLVAGSTPEMRKVVADKAKGVIMIKQSEDRLMHFCWKNRETGLVVEDLIIFPGDTEFIRIKEAPDGKVFMLKFKSSEERRLYWLQESAADADKGLVEKVNDTLNNPPQGRSGRSAAGASSNERVASSSANDEMNSLGNLGQDQLMQLLSFMNTSGGERGSDSAGGNNSNSAIPQASDLERLRSLMQGRNAPQRTRQSRPPIDLSEVITGERVFDTVRSNPDRLTPHVPSVEGCSPVQEVEATVRAPQFRQASDAFGHALQTGQLAPVFEQFGLPSDTAAAAANGDILEFAKKLTDSENGDNGESSNANEPIDDSVPEAETPDSLKGPTPKRGKPSDDDQMDLD